MASKSSKVGSSSTSSTSASSTSASSTSASSTSASSKSMHFTIRGVDVAFPCKPYPSQFSLMDKVITGCKNATHGLLESPTGSGKSLALLCSTLAWQRHAAAQFRDQMAANQEALERVCFCACHFETEKVGNSVEKDKKENPMPDVSADETLLNGDKEAKITDGVDDDDDDDDFKPVKVKRGKPRKSIQYDDEDKNGEDDQKENRKKKEALDGSVDQPKCQGDCCGNAGKPIGEEEKELIKTATGSKGKNSKNNKNDGDSKEAGPSKSDTAVDTLPKIYFCTRTHKQISQIVREFKKTEYSRAKMTILASREHTCIEPEVSRSRNKNDGCNEKLRKRKRGDYDGACSYYDNSQRIKHHVLVSNGYGCGWDLEDLLRFGRRTHACPFYSTKALREEAEIIFCPYNYLIDPVIRSQMEINLNGHVVILDEAHNMEDTAREAASKAFKRHELEEAILDLDKMMQAGILVEEHARLKLVVKQLALVIIENSDNLEKKSWDLESKVINGAETIRMLTNKSIGPEEFSNVKRSFHKVCAENKEPSDPLQIQINHSTLILVEAVVIVFTFLFRNDCKDSVDFKTIIKKIKSRNDSSAWRNRRRSGGGNAGVWLSAAAAANDDDEFEYHLQFLCLNPAVAFVDMAKSVRSIILASGTLSPMDSFQSELGLNFVQQLEANHVIQDKQALVSTVGIAPNGTLLKATHQNTDGLNFQDGLGDLVAEICARTSHGVLCFFSSYSLMNKLSKRWQGTGLWRAIGVKKKIFAEPRGGDKNAFDTLLSNFYTVIEETHSGPTPGGQDGALLLAVCRGKVSEGMDFTDNNARAVITVGIPYPSFVDTAVMEKKKYNNSFAASRGLLNGDRWYEIQAYRALNQALGRCHRHKNDWGALVLVDSRFKENPHKYINGLSKWVKSKVTHFNSCVEFLRELGEFQTARRREDSGRNAAAAAVEKGKAEETTGGTSVGNDDERPERERKSSDPDVPVYSIFTSVTPKRAPPAPQPDASATSSYFPSPASGVFAPTPYVARPFVGRRMRDDDEDDDEEESIRREFERMKSEVEAERTAVENERKKNRLCEGGNKKFDWRAKRDEAIKRRKEREQERTRKTFGEESRKEEERDEEGSSEDKSAVEKSDPWSTTTTKREVIDDDDVRITGVTKAKSWPNVVDDATAEREKVAKSVSASVVDGRSKKSTRSDVSDSTPALATSLGNNRKRLLFAPSPGVEENESSGVAETAARTDGTDRDKDRVLAAESEMDLFDDGTDDDMDMFAAARRLERGTEKGDAAAKTEINDDGGEVGMKEHPFHFSGRNDEKGRKGVENDEKKPTGKGGIKRRLSPESREGDDVAASEEVPKTRTVTPVKKVEAVIRDDDVDDDFVNKSANKSRRPSLKRFKKTADKSWTADQSASEDGLRDAGQRVAYPEPPPEPSSACASQIWCVHCGSSILSLAASEDSEVDVVSFRSLRFSFPRAVGAADDPSSLTPTTCLHGVEDVVPGLCVRATMTPREKEEAFTPMNPSEDGTTGLPLVSWAAELGCGLRALACYQCPSGRRQRPHLSNHFVALEVTNDSEKASPPLREGEILFPRRLIKLCPGRIDK